MKKDYNGYDYSAKYDSFPSQACGPMAGKWNYEKQEYNFYELPKDGNITVATYSDVMDKVVLCASCGKKIFFGDGYTSKTIHTPSGFGFAVCKQCYDKEVSAEQKYLAEKKRKELSEC